MPRYEFECRECGEEFSVFVPYSEKKSTRCPSCESAEIKEHYGLAIGGSGGSGGNGGGGSSRSPFT